MAFVSDDVPCYTPLHAFEGKRQESGKLAIVWKPAESPEQVKLDLPCGQCVGCRLERSRQWALRCFHEVSLHERNCFVTLTYDDEHLPANRSLDVSEFQCFMKRLRKRFGAKIRFFHAGEYGGKLGRPHYHALLFNHDFPDRVLLRKTPAGSLLYRSPELEKLWTKGYSSVGDVTFASAAYVARYSMKKVTGEKSFEHYVDRRTGEELKPEYVTMSRRPGIGARWFDRFMSDVFPSDEVVQNGRKYRPPRFYDNLLDKVDPDLLESLKLQRRSNVNKLDNDSFRLRVKEQVKLASISTLARPLKV